MKIIIVTESTLWGGLESHAVALAEALRDNGHQVSLVCTGAGTYEMYRDAAPSSVSLVDLSSPASRTLWDWWRAFRTIDADGAILEKGTLWTGGLALDVVLRLRYRRYIAIQQLEPPRLPPKTRGRHLGGLLPGVGLWWYRWKGAGYLRSLAPHVTVCVSDAVRRALMTDYGFPGRKLVTIRHGIDLERFRPDEKGRDDIRRQWGIPPDAFVFGSVRRFVREKGLDVLIEAFARLMAEAPDCSARVVLVGEGPEERALASLAERLGVSSRVIFAGFSASPWTAYPGFDVFVIPSRIEALGVVVLEAMASGCNVIGSAVGGIPEMISEAALGTLVPPDDPVGLASAMKDMMLQDRQTRILQRRATRQHVTDHFSLRARCMDIASLLAGTKEPDAMMPQ